jgi:hypothetical protein
VSFLVGRLIFLDREHKGLSNLHERDRFRQYYNYEEKMVATLDCISNLICEKLDNGRNYDAYSFYDYYNPGYYIKQRDFYSNCDKKFNYFTKSLNRLGLNHLREFYQESILNNILDLFYYDLFNVLNNGNGFYDFENLNELIIAIGKETKRSKNFVAAVFLGLLNNSDQPISFHFFDKAELGCEIKISSSIMEKIKIYFHSHQFITQCIQEKTGFFYKNLYRIHG